MAILEVATRRATANFSNQSVDTLAYPNNTTTNNLLICSGSVWDATPITSVTVTDTHTSSWTTILSDDAITTGHGRTFIAYALSAGTGANTVTVTFSTSTWGGFSIDEFSGVDTGTPLDVDGGESSGTSTAPLDTITTVGANALIIGAHGGGYGDANFTEGSGWTLIGKAGSAADSVHALQFKIVTTAQSYNNDATLDASLFWVAQSASFAEAVAGITTEYVAPVSSSQRGGNVYGVRVV